jgi:hypothetical protein
MKLDARCFNPLMRIMAPVEYSNNLMNYEQYMYKDFEGPL